MLDIAFAKSALPKTGGLVLLLAEEAAPTGLAAQLAAAMEGGLVRALEAAGFKGRKGQSMTLWAPVPGLAKLLVLGMGKETGAAAAEKLGGSAAAAMAGEAAVTIAADGLPGAEAASLAMGAALRHYRFDRYRTTEKPDDKPKLAKLTVATGEAAAAKAAWAPMKAVVNGVFLARDLVSEPPNVLNPVEFARRCEALTALGL